MSAPKALVSGSSQGLGKLLSSHLIQKGYQVVIHGRNLESTKKTAQELKSEYICCDLADSIALNESLKNHAGDFELLVCNAGKSSYRPPGEESLEDYKSAFADNFLSAVGLIDTFRKLSLFKTKAKIICVSSVAGIRNIGAPTPYASAKAALNMYVQSMAKPLALEGISINAIAPGHLLFEGSVWERKLSDDPQAVESMLKTMVASKSFGSPEDVFKLLDYLLGCSHYQTGAVLPIDGGLCG